MAEKKKKKGKSQESNMPKNYRSRMFTDYNERILPELMKDFSYSNVMQAPKMVKIVLNMGVGDANRDEKTLMALRDNMETIAGQKPVITKAKKSIANFKIRDGMPMGCMVTLRGQRMFDFLDRFVSICVPRIRDFRGLSPKSFDGRGNYSVGVKEQLIFPEINYDEIPRVQGMDIVFCTTARTDEEALALLKKHGMPFRD